MDEKNPFMGDSLRATFDRLKSLQNSSPLLKSIEKLEEINNPKNFFPYIPQIEQPELNPVLFQAPEVKIPAIGEKIDQICDFNQQLVATNKELIAHLEESNQKIAELQKEIAEERNSHKYDHLINAMVGLLGAIIGAAAGVAFTVLATGRGWL